MEDTIDQLTIEKVKNGFQVYLRDYRYVAESVRPIPYVFESMEILLKFVETQLNKK